MSTKTNKFTPTTVTFLSNLARFWSVVSIIFLLLLLIGTIWNSVNLKIFDLPTATEWIGLLFFPLGVLIGLILAWKWKLVGAVTTLSSAVVFYVYSFCIHGLLPRGPFIILVALPGLIFLIAALLTKQNGTGQPKQETQTKAKKEPDKKSTKSAKKGSK